MTRIVHSSPRLLLLCWTLLVAVHALGRLADAARPPVHWPEPSRLDVATASMYELTLLPGLGPRRAEALVLDRVREGPVRHVAELERIDGFGPATIRGFMPFACVPSQGSQAGGGSGP